LPCGFGDLTAAHVGDLIDAAAELRRILILRDEIGDELVDPLFQLGFLLGADRNEARSLFGLHHRYRIGRGQLEFVGRYRRCLRSHLGGIPRTRFRNATGFKSAKAPTQGTAVDSHEPGRMRHAETKRPQVTTS